MRYVLLSGTDGTRSSIGTNILDEFNIDSMTKSILDMSLCMFEKHMCQ